MQRFKESDMEQKITAIMEEAFKEMPSSFRFLCEKKGITRSLKEKIETFLKNGDFSEESLKTLKEALKKDFFEEGEKIYSEFLEESGILTQNLEYLKDKIDPVLLRKISSNINKMRTNVENYMKNAETVINNIEKILKAEK